MGDKLKEKVLPQIKAPEIINTIDNEIHIIEYWNRSCIRFGDKLASHAPTIRNHLRTLARIKLTTAAMDQDIVNLIDIFHPEKWDTFMKAVQHFAKHDKADLTEKITF